MVTNLMWPEWVLIPLQPTPFYIKPLSTSGGMSATGSEQVVGNTPGRGQVDLNGVRIVNYEQLRVLNAIGLNLAGRQNKIMAPTFGRLTAPWPINGGIAQRSFHCADLTDTILFSPGASYYSRVISAQAATAATAGDVALDIRMIRGSSPKSAMIFQHSEYAYPIKRVLSRTPDDDGDVYEVTLAIPLREAVAEDADLNFDDPRFRARLTEDSPLPVQLQTWKRGSLSLSFEEDV